MKVDRVCLYCGVDFKADHWNVARNRAKFCSTTCSHYWFAIEYKNKKNRKPKKDPTK